MRTSGLMCLRYGLTSKSKGMNKAKFWNRPAVLAFTFQTPASITTGLLMKSIFGEES